nr:MAG TPA: hypothetical protein [Caudoviricetes sp.]
MISQYDIRTVKIRTSDTIVMIRCLGLGLRMFGDYM